MRRVLYSLIGVIAVVSVIATVMAQNLGVSKETHVLQEKSQAQVSDTQISEKYVVENKSPGIPHEISYQGYLEDNGQPVNGVYTIEFSIWTSYTGGTCCWVRLDDVVIINGRFSIVLGTGAPIPSSCFTGGTERWLQIMIGGTPLTPRTKLTSGGYSYVSEQADNATKWADNIWGNLYPNANATQIQGEAVSSSQPSTNQVLKWSGSQWAPGEDQTGTGYWTYSSNILYPNSTEWRVSIGTNSPPGGPKFYVVSGTGDVAVKGIEPGGGSGGAGIQGECNSPYSCGVIGDGTSGGTAGVLGNASGADYGVYGQGSSGGLAGVCGEDNGAEYGVYYMGGIGGTDKRATLIRTSEGPTEMYAMESPEIWFEDVGEGQFVNGRCYVELDLSFLESVTINDRHAMKVFIQLNDDCNGTYVKRGKTGFEVIELNNGRNNASFTYRVLAKRKGYETQRMEVVESCYLDRTLYPDDNDPIFPPYWKEKRQKTKEAEAKLNEGLTK